MAPNRKRENRENRENQFYDVGVQGRKTGITLEDKGIRDEHGLEPISGIFSSPAKSPPKHTSPSKTGETVSESESMDIQESTIHDLVTANPLLRSARTHLPPPKARSPIKTALGSSPRRQSSMGPRATLGSSPIRHTSDMGINRRLDFEQEESGLQETPALSGSGQRRGQRRSVYSIERSPSRTGSAVMEESIQQELIAAEDPSVLNHIAEESDLPDMPDDIPMSEEARAGVEASVDDPDSEAISEPTKHPAKRGRKRKNNAIEPVAEEKVRKPRKRGPVQTSSAEAQKESKKNPATANAPPRRSKRLSDVTDHGTSKVQGQPGPASRRIGTPPAVPRPRGRPPKIKPGSGESDNSSAKEQVDEAVFKKPKTATKPKKKANATMSNEERGSEARLDGKLVDVLGNPLSSADIDQMSTISGGSRLGRGRGLSVFRELDPDAPEVERSRFGRHRVAPINFWFNDRIEYDHQGEMQNIVKKQNLDPPPKKNKTGRSKGKKSRLSAIAEDDEVPLEQWEQDDGVFIGAYRGYDRDTEQTTNEVYEETIAWAKKGIIPADVQSKAFKFTKLFADDNGLSFGRIDLEVDQEKRQKNTRRAHMVFHVTDGVVEAKVHENVLTVRRNGVFRVPQGNTYSIRNLSSGTSRIFFWQFVQTA